MNYLEKIKEDFYTIKNQIYDGIEDRLYETKIDLYNKFKGYNDENLKAEYQEIVNRKDNLLNTYQSNLNEAGEFLFKEYKNPGRSDYVKTLKKYESPVKQAYIKEQTTIKEETEQDYFESNEFKRLSPEERNDILIHAHKQKKHYDNLIKLTIAITIIFFVTMGIMWKYYPSVLNQILTLGGRV